MKENDAIDMFGALSQETRLRAVRYLVSCGDQGAAAGDVGKHVDATSSRASFHLAALEHAGIISSERQSRKIIYRANLEGLGRLISFLLNDCCADHPEVRACCGFKDKCC